MHAFNGQMASDCITFSQTVPFLCVVYYGLYQQVAFYFQMASVKYFKSIETLASFCFSKNKLDILSHSNKRLLRYM